MKRKPAYCYRFCPIARKTNGFAMPDSMEKIRAGARLFFWLEAAGGREAEENLPLIGPTGKKVWDFLVPEGLDRSTVILDNTLRCNPQNNEYPTDRQRIEAEAACRHFDYLLYAFQPTYFGVTFHPASLRTAPNTTRFFIEDVKYAFELAQSGEKVLMAMGAKALKVLMPSLPESMKKLHGSFFPLAPLPPLSPERQEELRKSEREIHDWQTGSEPEVDYYDSSGFWKPS